VQTERGAARLPQLFPRVPPLLRGSWIVLLTLNLGLILIHQTSFFERWLSMTEFAVDAVAWLIPALDQIASALSGTRYEHRIPFMQNAIAFNWLVAGGFQLAIAFHIVRGFQSCGVIQRKIREIRDELAASGRDMGLVFIAAFIGSVGLTYFLATGFGYDSPRGLYYSDWQLLIVCFLFSAAVQAVSLFIILLMFLRYQISSDE
jgi:hypothetical protein